VAVNEAWCDQPALAVDDRGAGRDVELPDGHDQAALHSDIADVRRRPGAIDDGAIAEHRVRLHGGGSHVCGGARATAALPWSQLADESAHATHGLFPAAVTAARAEAELLPDLRFIPE
jgi:hypothetical protein